MDNNVICKAEIKNKPKKAIIKAWYIIAVIVLVIGAIPHSNTIDGLPSYRSYEVNYTNYYWLFFRVGQYSENIAIKDGYYYNKTTYTSSGYTTYKYTDLYYDGNDPQSKKVRENGLTLSKKGDVLTSETYFEAGDLIVPIIITFSILFIPIILFFIISFISKHCTLELTNTGISGTRKKLFSTKNLDLPIDKVDSIMRSMTLYNKLTGGNTVAIRSASGLIKFPWVQNAEEFVNATLAKIEEYKKTVKNDNQELIKAVANTAATAPANNASSATKIKELKELLDQGLISQEEFDAKRKELLEKM